MALHLLKHCVYLSEVNPSKALSLFYLRTKEHKEVDFLLTKKGLPYLMIEVKTKDTAFSKNMIYFHDKYNVSGKQLCLNLSRQRQIKGKKIISENLEEFLLNLQT